ncbi:MAG: HNH endonuclease signature motif containing protein [Pseudomonadota bacterium]
MTTPFETAPRNVTQATRVKVFQRDGGLCQVCGVKIDVSTRWDVDHELSLENGGSNDPENLRLICVPCHKAKTAQDRKTAAKNRSVYAKHIGAKPTNRRPMPGSKDSPWRRRMDGTVVRREDGHAGN